MSMSLFVNWALTIESEVPEILLEIAERFVIREDTRINLLRKLILC